MFQHLVRLVFSRKRPRSLSLPLSPSIFRQLLDANLPLKITSTMKSTFDFGDCVRRVDEGEGGALPDEILFVPAPSGGAGDEAS